jgi:hypothetical protein
MDTAAIAVAQGAFMAAKIREKLACISFGEGGFSAEVVCHDPNTSARLSGYDRDPERVIPDLSGRYDAEGAILLDKRPVVNGPNGVKIVMRAPLLTLKEARAFSTLEVSPVLASGVSGSYAGILACAMAGALNLDYVGLADYVAYWREAGAKVGKVQGGRVVWE